MRLARTSATSVVRDEVALRYPSTPRAACRVRAPELPSAPLDCGRNRSARRTGASLSSRDEAAAEPQPALVRPLRRTRPRPRAPARPRRRPATHTGIFGVSAKGESARSAGPTGYGPSDLVVESVPTFPAQRRLPASNTPATSAPKPPTRRPCRACPAMTTSCVWRSFTLLIRGSAPGRYGSRPSSQRRPRAPARGAGSAGHVVELQGLMTPAPPGTAQLLPPLVALVNQRLTLETRAGRTGRAPACPLPPGATKHERLVVERAVSPSSTASGDQIAACCTGDVSESAIRSCRFGSWTSPPRTPSRSREAVHFSSAASPLRSAASRGKPASCSAHPRQPPKYAG